MNVIYKCILSIVVTGCFALCVNVGLCQTKTPKDSTGYVAVEIGSELHNDIKAYNLLQISNLIENAEDVLERTQKQLLNKPRSLKSTVKWNVTYKSKSKDGKMSYVIDTSSGALMISFSENTGKPEFMMFSPKFVTQEEMFAYLKEKYKITSTENSYAIRNKNGKKVGFSLTDSDQKIKGILIYMVP